MKIRSNKDTSKEESKKETENSSKFDNFFKKLASRTSENSEDSSKKFKDKTKKGENLNNNNVIISPFEKFINLDKLKSFKSKKNKIIKSFGLLAGVILISFGIILISNSIIKISDNVIFGEKAMFSVSLILLGVLIIAAVFASSKLLDKSIFKEINKETQAEDLNSKEPKKK
jgi:Ca2+/Na+ antiporter